MTTLAYILSGLALLMGFLFLIRLKSPFGIFVWFPKLFAGALSPIWAVMGVVGAVIGWTYQVYGAIPIGILGAGMMIWYVWRSTRNHTGFDNAFGPGWSDQIPPEQERHMVQKRWAFFPMKHSLEPKWERDVAFWTIPDTERDLLCDIWSPADGEYVSGLTLIYFHGSGWYMFDKDFGTRPFFRHLTAQGHTVMDVAYRLCPEVDIDGMIGDVKRAIAWMKESASRYGVNPKRIVLGGASAGGHLALLAGYAPHHSDLTPENLKEADLSVCGIISFYGPTDLLAMYQHTNQQQFEDQPPMPIGDDPDSTKSMSDAGRVDMLLGGHPQEIPDMYKLASPITHVHPDCPPTLLFHGKHDVLVPVDATCALYTKLVQSGVPVINIVFPGTDHGFDILLPQINPAAQSALYDVDRFLALLVNKD